MRGKPAVLISTISILAVLVTGCGSSAPQPSSTQASGGPLEVDVVKVTTQTLATVQAIPGELLPYEAVAVYPKVTGFVKSIAVDRGSRIRQGELLAVLEAPELASQRAEAESKLAAAESDLASAQAKLSSEQGTYERLAVAAKTPGVVAPNDLAVAQQAAEAERANVAARDGGVKAAQSARSAVAEIEGYLRITAPFDGIVTERNVHPGALVGPAGGPGASTPMLRIETVARLRLVVPIPEGDVADVPSGASIKFTVPAYPTETFQAPVARISRAIDVSTRTMPVELEVANNTGRLTAGTFCAVQWPVHRSYPTHFVPSGAVTSNQERTFVIAVRAGKAEWVDVKTGATVGSSVEVFGGLNDQDEVVLRGTDAIRPGATLSAHMVAMAK